MKDTLPHLEAAGSKVLFMGESRHFAIGPEHEKWDIVLFFVIRSPYWTVVPQFTEEAHPTTIPQTGGVMATPFIPHSLRPKGSFKALPPKAIS